MPNRGARALRVILLVSIDAILSLSFKVKCRSIVNACNAFLVIIKESSSCYHLQIDLHDEDVYELASEDKNYNEESENELIKPVDIAQLQSIRDDDSRFKPLHSYVQNYNDNQMQMKPPIIDAILLQYPRMLEAEVELEERPYIAGFKSFLDKFYESSKSNSGKRERARIKGLVPRSIENRTAKIGTDQVGLAVDGDEEEYDYDKLKQEYYDQLRQETQTTRQENDAHPLNETARDEIKDIVDVISQNCSGDAEGLSIETVKCFVHGIQDEKYYKTSTKKRIRKIWLTLKIWLIIYAFVAVILWCHKGWCCCCFRCKFCFPKKRLLYTKQYYVKNPPGVLAEKFSTSGRATRYEATELEEDAYEQLEVVIRTM